jgi:aspartate/tyrosine/aromatic aminotransferase
MFFHEVAEAPPDPIFGLLGAFQADVRKEKVNLMVGIYKDERLRAEPLSSVKRVVVGMEVADYLPIDGLAELVELLGPVVFGGGWDRERMYGAHTVGGTGALRVGGEFLVQEVTKVCAVPNHTWPNHRLLERAGMTLKTYPYYSREKRGFDVEALLGFLRGLPKKTAVMLHACCHNPTGCDPNEREWREISRVMKEGQLVPFFDFAYQGLGEGVEKDAEAIRLFVREGHEMLVAYSCSKNFSMYSQRVGALFVVGENTGVKMGVGSQVKRIIRALYSNPPEYGARVVVEVLKKERELWLKDLEGMRARLGNMRRVLVEKLGSEFDYLQGHKGMFSFIDLDKGQVKRLIDEYAIYMTDNGRISVAGLSRENVDYVVRGILSVCGRI